MNIFIKICGITNPSDAKASLEYRADALGFIQTKKSKRFISLETLNEIKREVGNNFLSVPVFVNPDRNQVLEFLNIFPNSIIQFHGDEEEDFCLSFKKPFIKALNVTNQKELLRDLNNFKKSHAYLLDSGDSESRGGTGETFDWKLIPKELSDKIIVAGGLNSNNINILLDDYIPYGIDVSSGVESIIGVKDHKKIKNFIKTVRSYE